jgi:hypothetical protein
LAQRGLWVVQHTIMMSGAAVFLLGRIGEQQQHPELLHM